MQAIETAADRLVQAAWVLGCLSCGSEAVVDSILTAGLGTPLIELLHTGALDVKTVCFTNLFESLYFISLFLQEACYAVANLAHDGRHLKVL